MQPDEVKRTVRYGLLRQGAHVAVGRIDDDSLDLVGAAVQESDLMTRVDDEPSDSCVDRVADRRHRPAMRVHDDMHRVDPVRRRPLQLGGCRNVDRYALPPNPRRKHVAPEQLRRVAHGSAFECVAVQRTAAKSNRFINERKRLLLKPWAPIEASQNVRRK